jgi:anthranilate phosphoribosyltransferase
MKIQRSGFSNYDLYEHANNELMKNRRRMAFQKIMNCDYKLTDPFTLKVRVMPDDAVLESNCD